MTVLFGFLSWDVYQETSPWSPSVSASPTNERWAALESSGASSQPGRPSGRLWYCGSEVSPFRHVRS